MVHRNDSLLRLRTKMIVVFIRMAPKKPIKQQTAEQKPTHKKKNSNGPKRIPACKHAASLSMFLIALAQSRGDSSLQSSFLA